MYLLYLDESGTHADSPNLIIAGVAVHEQDCWPLETKLASVLRKLLPPGNRVDDFEIHASAVKQGKAQHWAQIPYSTRMDILRAAYEALEFFRPTDVRFPPAFFGAVVDKFHTDRERWAYEEVLARFDEMLTRRGNQDPSQPHQRGVVVHDERSIEPDVQKWTNNWRRAKGRLGRLDHIVDVPMFADSRASRLLQAADLVCWALWRYYGLPVADTGWVDRLWNRFDAADGRMHGLAHLTPAFKSGQCHCPPCTSRRSTAGTAIGFPGP